MSDYEYEVALSFATEDRDYVDEVHRGLTALGIKTFYYMNIQGTVWSDSVGEYLDKIFGTRTRFCVVFLSKDYARKEWTKRELKATESRKDMRKQRDFLLPVRIDDTPIEGIDPDIGFLRTQDYRARELANKIAEKLGLSLHEQHARVRSENLRPVSIRFRTSFDLDVNSVTETLRPFLRWAETNAFNIPCEVTYPEDLNCYFTKVQSSLTNRRPVSEEGGSETQAFSDRVELARKRISQGVRAAASVVIGVRNNRGAEKDISDVELQSIFSTYITATVVNLIFDIVKWNPPDLEPPIWLTPFFEVAADVGDIFYRGLAFVSKNTAEELLFWTNAEVYFEDSFRLTKSIYVPSQMLLSGHHDTPSREHFIKFIMPQLIHLTINRTDERLNNALLKNIATYPERLRIYAQGKWFIELEHFQQLSNGTHDLKHVRDGVTLALRDLIRRGQFSEVESMYENYEPSERKDVAFEHVMMILDSVLRT